MDTSEQTLRRIYRAFNARDIDQVLTVMHPEVDWPNAMEGGRVLGHRGVREYWTRQWKVVNPRVEPIAFSDDRQDGPLWRYIRSSATRTESCFLTGW